MELSYRNPTQKDLPYLAETVIEAEMSGSGRLSYTSIFGLDRDQAKECIVNMLEEDVEGCCELSFSSFLIAESEGEAVGAIAAWVEAVDGMPSSVQKGNLLRVHVPRENFEKAIALSPLLRQQYIEYERDSIHMGLAFVEPKFRGKGVVGDMFTTIIDKLRKEYPNVQQAFLQVFDTNIPGIKAYERFGFEFVDKRTGPPELADYLPSNTKLLMQLKFK